MHAREMPSSDGQALWETWLSRYWSPAVYAADQLGLFKSFAEGPAGADELSSRLNLNRRAVGVLLPMLASLGYLVRQPGGYQLTDTARHYLLPSSPFYWGGVIEFHREMDGLSARLIELATRPDPAEPIPEPVAATPPDAWAAGEIAADVARGIARYMQSTSLGTAIGLAANGDFSKARRLLDVGGGSGCFSIALVERFPALSCTIMDLPRMCELAQEYIDAAGVAERVATLPRDMFRQEWPDGYDAVLFSNVLHDWRPPTCAELLRQAYAALPSGGMVFLHEALLNEERSGPRSTAGMGVLMLLSTQGQQFSGTELFEMLDAAGFVDLDCAATSPLYSLIRGKRA